MAPVLRRLAKEPGLRSLVCVTAQHREMLDQVLALFEIHPDHDLDLMREGQTLTEVTTRALTELAPYLDREKPDFLLVQGDTTTTMAASLAAFYARVPVLHVEAGLRTGDPYYPYPEEVNRRITTVIAAHHFAPTESARRNLLREGVADSSITVTGNTVIDALLEVVPMEPKRLPQLPLRAERLVLVTAHRRESFGSPLEDILLALRRLARSRPDVRIVHPVHPNPRVRETAERLLTHAPQNLVCTGPLPYRVTARLLSRAFVVLTDSGGLQEEAPFLGKPTLVLRDVTERVEVVEAGTARLVGTRGEDIAGAVEVLLDDPEAYAMMAVPARPYGDGDASPRIADALFRQGADGPWEGRAMPAGVEVAG